MGKLGWEVSALGFGMMRLPVVDNDWSKIDLNAAKKMVRYAIDNGVNYVDTAWPYHESESEKITGEILKDGYREKVKLVTKLPIYLVKEAADFDKYLNLQLERLQTTYLDIYLLHGIDKVQWDKLKKINIMERAEKAKKDEKIKYIGFSFHGGYEGFKQIIDEYDWDMAQIQYNYIDENIQATKAGLEYAASKGIPVAIMEPLKGGKLAELNEFNRSIIDKAPIKRTPAEWALNYIWDHPGVSVVLSGMSNFQQVKQNVESADKSDIHMLTPEEYDIIKELQDLYENKIKVPCTDCKYCMPCPSGVDIPGNFKVYNDVVWNGEIDDWNRFFYMEFSKPDKQGTWIGYGPANLCVECGECLEKCPQKIEIPERLAEIVKIFEENEPLSEFLP